MYKKERMITKRSTGMWMFDLYKASQAPCFLTGAGQLPHQ